MAAPRDEQLLEQIIALTRAHCLRRWGRIPLYLKFIFSDGCEQQELLPPAAVPALPPPALPAPAPPAPAGPRPWDGQPWHAPDFSVVRWPGHPEYVFGEKQATVVGVLWDARFDGSCPDVGQQTLLHAAESDGQRLRDLFRNHPAWGELVVQGARAGSFRLPELPEDIPDDAPV